MNERIRELAGQAKFMAEEDINRQISYNAELKAFAEKFAELIVAECVAICEDTEGEHIADAKWGRRCCALEIREHFGVEE
jgi:hypothetical protein